MLRDPGRARQDLLGLLRREVDAPMDQPARAAALALRRRHGDAVAAILFYGSCLRQGSAADSVLDFYVFVDSYEAFHQRRAAAALNAMLPPNVYVLALAEDATPIRAKYAVVSLKDLARGTSRQAFQPYLWGRFAQPCALLYARDDEVRDRVLAALASAVETMFRETLPLMPSAFTPRELWTRALRESYRTELRAERAGHSEQLFQAFAERYGQLSRTLVTSDPQLGTLSEEGAGEKILWHSSRSARARCLVRWRARRVLGKSLHILRLMKSAFTFKDGIDYIVWKIERHSGVRSELSPWQRRHPLIAAPSLAWRLFRRGAFR